MVEVPLCQAFVRVRMMIDTSSGETGGASNPKKLEAGVERQVTSRAAFASFFPSPSSAAMSTTPCGRAVCLGSSTLALPALARTKLLLLLLVSLATGWLLCAKRIKPKPLAVGTHPSATSKNAQA